jgi:phosphohistidine phosphatase
MRHAQAQIEKLSPSDRERPITMAGMHEIESIRSQIQGHLSNINLVLCSNARRTRQTLEGIRPLLPANVTIMYDDDMYHCSANVLWRKIVDVDPTFKAILIIGHNPGITQFIKDINPPTHLVHEFPTCGVAIFEVKEKWRSITSTDMNLTRFLRP